MNVQNRMWDHQRKSVEFLLPKRAGGLFSGMGSGKTRVAIEVVRLQNYKKVLIVVPKNVLVDHVWPNQIEKYFDKPWNSLTLEVGTSAQKSKLVRNSPMFGTAATAFIIVNYDSVWRQPLGDAIMQESWDCIILDEAHKIKAAGSKVSLYMKRLGSKTTTKKKMALTGTPNPNSPLDVYGLFRFLDSSVFGTNYGTFSRRYAIFGGFNNYQVLKYVNLDELREKMSSLSIRFETKDVIDLPETMDITRNFEMGEDTRRVYKEMADEFTSEVEGGTVTASNILVKSLRLRQVVGGQIKSDDGKVHILGNDKIRAFEEVLDELPTGMAESGVVREPLVVFCTFTADIYRVKKSLVDYGYSVGELSGQKNELQKWHDLGVNALVVQIATGSEGIDLTRSAYAIYYSPCWDLGTYEQSRARLSRPGQTRHTRFIHIVAKKTIEETMMKALINKRSVTDYVMAAFRARV